MNLREHWRALDLPTGPVVYLARDAAGVALYVGKSNNLRRRLAAHYSSSIWWGYITALQWCECPTEKDALRLESVTIGLLRPSWNIAHNPDRRALAVKPGDRYRSPGDRSKTPYGPPQKRGLTSGNTKRGTDGDSNSSVPQIHGRAYAHMAGSYVGTVPSVPLGPPRGFDTIPAITVPIGPPTAAGRR